MAAISVEDRLAIEDLAVAYCTAVDAIGDVEGVCAVFTEDAVYDLSGYGMAALGGHAEIRTFFAAAFPSMAHNAHYLSNFAITAYAGETASARAYVHAYSKGTDGSEIEVRARYYFDVVRGATGWKIAHLALDFLIPPA